MEYIGNIEEEEEEKNHPNATDEENVTLIFNLKPFTWSQMIVMYVCIGVYLLKYTRNKLSIQTL